MIADEIESELPGIRDSLRSIRHWNELLTIADRQALLSDIARIGLAIARDLGSNAADLDIGRLSGNTLPCPAERLGYLQHVAPQLVSAVRCLESEPPPSLRLVARDMRIDRATRVSPTALRTLVRSLPNPDSGQLVSEARMTPTRDTPENRAAKTIVASITRDTADIATLAQEAGLHGTFARAEVLHSRLDNELRRPFWRDLPILPRVQPRNITQRQSGPHTLLHDIYRAYRAGFAWDWTHSIFRLPSRETWLLYEYWCFFHVVDVLQRMGFVGDSSDNLIQVAPHGVGLALVNDRPSRLKLIRSGKTVTVTYQQRFERGDPSTSGIHSRGHLLIPDLTVATENRFLILDAKFKTYTVRDLPHQPYRRLSALEDVRQLHAYRDALRSGDDKPVHSAWALYPGRADFANRPIIAFPESSPARPFGNGEVGAILLRPSAPSPLDALVQEFLFSHPV